MNTIEELNNPFCDEINFHELKQSIIEDIKKIIKDDDGDVRNSRLIEYLIKKCCITEKELIELLIENASEEIIKMIMKDIIL